MPSVYQSDANFWTTATKIDRQTRNLNRCTQTSHSASWILGDACYLCKSLKLGNGIPAHKQHHEILSCVSSVPAYQLYQNISPCVLDNCIRQSPFASGDEPPKSAGGAVDGRYSEYLDACPVIDAKFRRSNARWRGAYG